MLTNWLVTLRVTPKTSISIPTVKGQTIKVSLLSKGEMVVVWLSLKLSRLRSSIVSLPMYSPKHPKIEKSAQPMSNIHISNEGVIKMMKGLNPSKALGPDELNPRVLKELTVELDPVFAHLFQQSVDKGEIPKEWSLANICPLHKQGDRALSSNYCLVSLTCVPCKMREHIVCTNIMAHQASQASVRQATCFQEES